MFDIFPIEASVGEYITGVLYLRVYYYNVKSPTVIDDHGAMEVIPCCYGIFSQRN